MEPARRVARDVDPDPAGYEPSTQDRVRRRRARRDSDPDNVIRIGFSGPPTAPDAAGVVRHVGDPPRRATTDPLLEVNVPNGEGRSARGWVRVLGGVAGPQVLEEAEAALGREWAVHERVPRAVRIQLGIAVAEIVANTIEHGSAGRHLVHIQMRISFEPGCVRIMLIDDGNEFHADVNTVAMPEGLAERGRGLAMARLALDGLVYQRLGVANCWLLTSKPIPA